MLGSSATRRSDDKEESATFNGDYGSGDSHDSKSTRQKRRKVITPKSADGSRTTCTGEGTGLGRASPSLSKLVDSDVHVADSDGLFLSADACESSDEEEFALKSDDHVSKEPRGPRRCSTRSKCKGKGKRFSLKGCNDKAGIRRRARPPAEAKRKSRAKSRLSKDDRPARFSRLVAGSSSDDEGILQDSDGEGESYDRGDSFAEHVHCRCGAKDWKDGDQLIRCDGRDCWTWEHSRCA